MGKPKPKAAAEPERTNVTLYMDAALLERLREAAKADKRNLSNYVEVVLEAAMSAHNADRLVK